MNIRIDTFPVNAPANDPHRPASCPLCAADRLREAEGWTDWPPLDPPEMTRAEAAAGVASMVGVVVLALAMIAVGIAGLIGGPS